MCLRECIDGALVEKEGRIVPGEGHCMACGHCLAVCPVRAVSLSPEALSRGHREDDILEYDPEQFGLDPERLLKAVKFGRSIRHYLPQPVEEEKILQIIEAGRYTATAANFQDVSYIVLRDKLPQAQKAAMRKFRFLAGLAAKVGRVVPLPIDADKWSRFPDDFLFHGAPVAILTVSRNPIDASLVAANMKLQAEALGLGVLHCGFFAGLASFSPELKRIIGLPRWQKVINCLCIGYPAVRFHRTVTRNPARIIWS